MLSCVIGAVGGALALKHIHFLETVLLWSGSQFLIVPLPYTALGIRSNAFRAAASSLGSPVPVTSFPMVTQ